jgi:hypothetical protein
MIAESDFSKFIYDIVDHESKINQTVFKVKIFFVSPFWIFLVPYWLFPIVSNVDEA